MNVNKKFDRLKQWGKERIGSEVKTDTSEEFKALELEMSLRHDGMERLKKSSDVYMKWMSKRDKYEDKEQQLPVGYFGSTMVSHGDDFEPDSEFGQCLSMLGRANERMSRMQETYCANATSSWLESQERSLMQMKEYQNARKKLDSRRLGYDTAAIKMQKSKKEDFRMEEELRSQKLKYEESGEDVYRRMLDIKEAEVDSVADLTSFLEAELAYYDRCREVLLQLKREWPASAAMPNRSGTSSPVNGGGYRRNPRSRAGSLADRVGSIAEDESPELPMRPPTIGSRSTSGQNSPRRELPGFDLPVRSVARATTATSFESPTSLAAAAAARDHSPHAMPGLTRITTEPTRSNLRIQTARDQSPSHNVFGDDNSSDQSDTPSSIVSQRKASILSTAAQDGSMISTTKRAPPPPPPSRATKPPAPPLKRSALSASAVPRY